MSSTRSHLASCGRISVPSIGFFSVSSSWLPLLRLLPITILGYRSCGARLALLVMPAWQWAPALAPVGAIDPTPTQQGPHDPGMLIGHRDRRSIPPTTLE